jgi:dihydrofolate reductase
MIAIVACDAKWGIGCDGKLQQRVSADLRRFKALTWGKVVIYGRNTLDTFPGGKPLPGSA